MDGKLAFDQLVDYTKEVCKLTKIAFDAKGRHNWRAWDEPVGPTGFLEHFTASNASVAPQRPLGRIPNLLKRFARNSGSPGVHLIAWDVLQPQFADLRKKYDVYQYLECDVFCWGLDVAYYHGNAANGWAVGIENRNIGKLTKRVNGTFGWGKGGVNDYVGRNPVNVRGFWCEPFTRAQVAASVQLLRWLREFKPIREMKITGHENITSNRTDPSPHFPLKLVRDMAFDLTIPIHTLDQFPEFVEDTGFFTRYDSWIEDDLEDNVEDSDPDLIFGRDGDTSTLPVEDDPSLYGEDGAVTPGDVVEGKRALIQLGYWPLADNEAVIDTKITPEYTWSMKLFQCRWVVNKGGKWVRILKDTGVLDQPTAGMLNRMLRQWKFVT